jgi:hypothetical protein
MTKTERQTLGRLLDVMSYQIVTPIAQLARDAGLVPPLSSGTSSCPRLRAILRKGTMELGLPIVATQDGFFLANSGHELRDYALSLFTRSYEIQKHADAVRQVAESDLWKADKLIDILIEEAKDVEPVV